jgi:hypothetical protein
VRAILQQKAPKFEISKDSEPRARQRYSLPHIALEQKYKLQCCPHQLAINSDGTRFSIIDLNGMMTLYDMEAGKGKEENDMGYPPGEIVQGFERRWAPGLGFRLYL